jgi:hypothetical protein
MAAVDSREEPEQMIATLKRRRQITVVFALAGIVVGLVTLFAATGAMYAKDPMRELQIERAALKPSPATPPVEPAQPAQP